MIHINPYSWTDDQPLILAICPSLDHGTCAGSYWLSRNHATFEKPDAGRRVARCGGPHSHILQCCLNVATLCYPLFLFGFSLRYCTWMQIRSWSPFSQFFKHCNTHPYPTSSKSYRHMSGYARHVYINVSSMILWNYGTGAESQHPRTPGYPRGMVKFWASSNFSKLTGDKKSWRVIEREWLWTFFGNLSSAKPLLLRD